ncbi:MAG: exodeoxyribonuclease VII small subunit [Ruminococcus sp.]|nr:exodeoxyribonuclease VII small subunit [Ruminococcus sp.]
MTFEDSIKRLDEIVKAMEEDKLSLDDALDLYKEGVELSVECKKSLEEARLQVKNLSEGENKE